MKLSVGRDKTLFLYYQVDQKNRTYEKIHRQRDTNKALFLPARLEFFVIRVLCEHAVMDCSTIYRGHSVNIPACNLLSDYSQIILYFLKFIASS